ncbi:uncharacterized protein HD556DRAFT_1484364 [Suillus plorans]|uniref:GATA-type domain-containing protein n=1 Tax=Suillus plorans TaxID=116603 RepID=A0A9P7DVC9_9AGAM|nr:uncharacterized protein HD556DRAFT_1484364 [Suillus plorans]KAG1803852.1 hypothetical protein HD556DRAFT_1484364 [Suillus plorans]
MWLKASLASHSLSCLTCDSSGFDGCISYDGVCITRLVTAIVIHDFPRWMYYSDGVVEVNLSSLFDKVLLDCVCRLSLPRERSKKSRLHAVLSHFTYTRMTLLRSDEDRLRAILSSATVHAQCTSPLLPLLATYFSSLYGDRICDLEDSKGHYSALLNTYDLRGTRVQSPDVRDEHGVRIHVSEYKTKLTEGTIVELEVILKLWTIKPRSNNASNPRDANGSRIYQMMLQHMQLLPCEKYMQAAFVNSIKDGREKRKATNEASEAMVMEKDDTGGASSLASALSTLSLAAAPQGGKTVCNVCGLYYKLHGSARPISMKSDIIRKRSRHDTRAQRSSLTEPPSASNTPGTPSVIRE